MKKMIIPAALCAASAVLTAELYRYTFRREGSRLLAPFFDKRGHEDAYYIRRDNAAAALRSRPREKLQILSGRGEKLTGYYYPGSGEKKRIAFIIHGYRSEHTETAGMYYDYYATHGFDIFCCDQTAHGESEGTQIGFDFYETEDCLLWIDELIRRFGSDVQIVLHGFSMGSATVMRMSSRCPGQVKFLVADCGYASGEEQLKPALGPMYQPMRLLNRLIAGYDLRDTDVRPSLSRSRLPILFVHGRRDKSVPFSNAELLFDFYSGPKDCFFVDEARHVESMYIDPKGYARHLDAFISNFIS